MLELIAKFGLFFGQPTVIVCIIVVGFLLGREAVFGRALFLLLFTMIYNVYLKSIWQMPLPPPLEGWAFPSGHMHSAVVFWGWLAIEYRKIWYAELTFFLLCLIGYGIVYHGYHYPIDILGAVAFGSISLVLYSLLQRLPYFKQKPYRLGFFLTILGLIITGLLPPEGRKPHMFQALGALIGFSAGWYLSQKSKSLHFGYGQKILLVVFAVSGAFLIAFLANHLPLSPKILIFAKFLGVGLWVSACKMVIGKLLKIQMENTIAPERKLPAL